MNYLRLKGRIVNIPEMKKQLSCQVCTAILTEKKLKELLFTNALFVVNCIIKMEI